MLFKRQRISANLELLDRLPLTDSEAAKREAAIVTEITALWQTDEVRRRPPTVQDEIKMGLDYYSGCLIDMLPNLYEEFAEALRRLGVTVATGVFGAMMSVELVNEGPVTILLDSDKTF